MRGSRACLGASLPIEWHSVWEWRWSGLAVHLWVALEGRAPGGWCRPDDEMSLETQNALLLWCACITLPASRRSSGTCPAAQRCGLNARAPHADAPLADRDRAPRSERLYSRAYA